MKSISFVLTLLLSSVLAAPFDSTYSSLSAREEAGFFDDLKGGKLGPRGSDDAVVARATEDLDKLLAAVGNQKDDGESHFKREEALLGGLLNGLLGGGASGSAGARGLTKGLTGKLDGLTGGLTGGTDAVGGLTKGLTGKLDGLTGGLTGGKDGSAGVKLGGKTGEDFHEFHVSHNGDKGSDKQKREEAVGGVSLSVVAELLKKLGVGKRDEALSKREEAIGHDVLCSLIGGCKNKREEQFIGGLGLEELLDSILGGLGKREEQFIGGLGLEELLELLGLGQRDEEALSKREEALRLGGKTLLDGPPKGLGKPDEREVSKREEAIGGVSLDAVRQLLAKLGLGKREEAILSGGALAELLKKLGVGKRDEEALSKREEAILSGGALAELLKKLGVGKRDEEALSKREEAIGDDVLCSLIGGCRQVKREEPDGLSREELVELLQSLGLGKRDGQELSERETAGLGKILSLELLPLRNKGGKRSEPNAELVDPIIPEGSSTERRDTAFVSPELVKALLKKLEEAKKGNGNDKRAAVSHDEADRNISDEEKEILAAILSGAIAIDPVEVPADDKADDEAHDASDKTKEAADAAGSDSA